MQVRVGTLGTVQLQTIYCLKFKLNFPHCNTYFIVLLKNRDFEESIFLLLNSHYGKVRPSYVKRKVSPSE